MINQNSVQFIELVLGPLLILRFPQQIVWAGFPSPAEDFSEKRLELQTFLVQNPVSTFIFQVSGQSMEGAGIFSGDHVIVDRSLKPENGHVVVAIIDGGFTVKRYKILHESIWLFPENKHYQPIRLTEEMDPTIWGVVTFVLHKP